MKLFISTFNRPEYLSRSLESLLESFSAIYPEILITDDGSTDPTIHSHLDRFKTTYPGKVRIVYNKQNKGIPQGKLDPIYKEIHQGKYKESYFLITDSDMIYKKGWIEELVYLYEQTKAPIITGFNTLTNDHKIEETHNHFYVKNHVGGCNLLVNTEFYQAHPFNEPEEWDFRMCERAHQQHVLGVIATNPSVVDHIGEKGYWARSKYHDKAIDYDNKL